MDIHSDFDYSIHWWPPFVCGKPSYCDCVKHSIMANPRCYKCEVTSYYLQTESSRQGCIAPGFFIPADKTFSSGMHRLRNYTPDFRAPPQSAELASIHLNACRALPHLIKPTVPILKLPAFIPDDLLYYISCMVSGICRNVMFSAKSRYAVTIRFSCFISSWLR